MTASRKTFLALAAVALAQTAVLAWIVIDRVYLLRTGREIALPIVPIDPRDLFKGEYVRLGFEISRLPSALLDGTQPEQQIMAFYVMLEKKDDGSWNAIKITRNLPADGGSPGRIVLRARLPSGRWAQPYIFPRYGIESYYVPQGEGPRLEALARQKKLAALVAVDKAGNAAIKGLIIDGKLQYEEPLF
jgi:uncharacterized membrane-anchored protein